MAVVRADTQDLSVEVINPIGRVFPWETPEFDPATVDGSTAGESLFVRALLGSFLPQLGCSTS